METDMPRANKPERAESLMASPFTINVETRTKEWEEQAGDYYLVTGQDRAGKRFRTRCNTWQQGAGINGWQGSKWVVRNGKKWLITRVYN